MPVLPRKSNAPVADTPEAANRPDRSWITAVIVVGSVLLATALGAAALVYRSRRDYREARKLQPSLTHTEFQRRRKMSEVARQSEEEAQRRIMIRKSLASKSTTWSSQCDNESLEPNDGRLEHRDSGLKDDWKEWEARLQQERPERVCSHPATAALPAFPMPTMTGSRAPSSHPLVGEQDRPRPQEPHQPVDSGS